MRRPCHQAAVGDAVALHQAQPPTDSARAGRLTVRWAAQRLQPGAAAGVACATEVILRTSCSHGHTCLIAPTCVCAKRRLHQAADAARPGRTLAARVARINPAVQAGSRSVLVYLALAPTEGLRQGAFLQGTLGTGEANALTVPATAVRTDKPQPYVQALRDGKLAHLPVQTGVGGEHTGERSVGVTGLPAGTVVVRGSLGPLREGTPVENGGAHARPARQRHLNTGPLSHVVHAGQS